jgi:hypothetical protein
MIYNKPEINVVETEKSCCCPPNCSNCCHHHHHDNCLTNDNLD